MILEQLKDFERIVISLYETKNEIENSSELSDGSANKSKTS